MLVDNYFVNINSTGFYGEKDNEGKMSLDKTLVLLQEQAVITAKSGADVIVTLGRVDNEVSAVRCALNANGFEYTPILSYAGNFASTLAHAIHTDPIVIATHKEGSYASKIGLGNPREAMRQIKLNIEQGTDYIGIKPAFFNMDIIARVKRETDMLVSVYVVSKEYAMVKAAAKLGYLDEKDTVNEMNIALKRAGANKIMTYWAREIVQWLDN